VNLCTNLEVIQDEATTLTYTKLPLPSSVATVEVTGGYGEDSPSPVMGTGIDRIQITPAYGIHTGFGDFLEPRRFPRKVQNLLAEIDHLRVLDLVFPELYATFETREIEIIRSSLENNPLPSNLQTIGTLSIELDYCTIEKRSERELHWVYNHTCCLRLALQLTTQNCL